MKNAMAVTALISAVLLAGCDAVRVPGVERPDEAAPPTTTEAPTPPTSEPEPAPSDTASTTTDAEPGDDMTDATTVEAPPPAPIYRLAEINAAACGLPETEAPTPTIAELNEAAETAPQPEGLFGVQVVGVPLAVASLDLFPGIVKMEPVNFLAEGEAKGHCGATRIADSWFLTAAHCIDEGYDEIRFIAGAVNVRDAEEAQIFEAESAICHAGYDGLSTGMINDIALIRVSEETLPSIRNVPIATYGHPDKSLTAENYATAVMAGWGSTSYGSRPSPELLSAEIRVISASPGVIVVESLDGKGPCQGDSGGPLYVQEDDGQQRVVGVLSNVQSASGSTPCAGTYRGSYTNVGGYGDWIDGVISACEANSALCRN